MYWVLLISLTAGYVCSLQTAVGPPGVTKQEIDQLVFDWFFGVMTDYANHTRVVSFRNDAAHYTNGDFNLTFTCDDGEFEIFGWNSFHVSTSLTDSELDVVVYNTGMGGTIKGIFHVEGNVGSHRTFQGGSYRLDIKNFGFLFWSKLVYDAKSIRMTNFNTEELFTDNIQVITEGISIEGLTSEKSEQMILKLFENSRKKIDEYFNLDGDKQNLAIIQINSNFFTKTPKEAYDEIRKEIPYSNLTSRAK